MAIKARQECIIERSNVQGKLGNVVVYEVFETGWCILPCFEDLKSLRSCLDTWAISGSGEVSCKWVVIDVDCEYLVSIGYGRTIYGEWSWNVDLQSSVLLKSRIFISSISGLIAKDRCEIQVILKGLDFARTNARVASTMVEAKQHVYKSLSEESKQINSLIYLES